MRLRLAKLEGMRVWNEDGSCCGRVFELRIDAKPGRQRDGVAPEIELLLCGRSGLLERLGWKQRSLFAIPWEHVRRVSGRGVTLRKGPPSYPIVKP